MLNWINIFNAFGVGFFSWLIIVQKNHTLWNYLGLFFNLMPFVLAVPVLANGT